MPLPDRPKELLALSDNDLFLGGACHIFADELSTMFLEQDYRLCAVEAEQWMHHPDSGEELFRKIGLVHVMVGKDDAVIDVNGIILESNYLDEYCINHHRFCGLRSDFRKASLRDCSRDELFKLELDEEETGPMSIHRLCLHPEFVAEARSRARLLIEARANCFEVGAAQFRQQIFTRNPLGLNDCSEEVDGD